MRITKFVIKAGTFVFVIAFIISTNAWGQIPPNNDLGWENSWFNDDFYTFDSNIWKIYNNDDHWENQTEKPYTTVYTNRDVNVKIDNSGTGYLILTLKREDYTCPPNDCYYCDENCINPSYHFTSGQVSTKSSYNVQYGYIEARINIPYGFGFWPAFWTINGGVSNNNAAEIDVFEMGGDKPATIMGTNLHLKYCDCENYDCPSCNNIYDQQCPTFDPTILCYGQDVTIPSYANTYHTYGIEWSPTKMNWYVDGNLVRNFPNPGIIDPVSVIFNFALFTWPDTSFQTADMKIDYLKMYKLKNDCNTVINSISYNFTGYDNKQKKSIAIGGTGGSVTYPANANISLRANDYIELKEGFNVPLGAQVYIDVDQCY